MTAFAYAMTSGAAKLAALAASPVRTHRRFAAKIALRNNGCVEWTAYIGTSGYGQFTLRNQHPVGAHRYAYEVCIGPIPSGYQIDHLCRNKCCVNPDHLEAVTPAENTRRCPNAPATVNSLKTHCPRGHEYTPENTYSGRSRRCITCYRASQNKARRWDKKRRVAQ